VFNIDTTVMSGIAVFLLLGDSWAFRPVKTFLQQFPKVQ